MLTLHPFYMNQLNVFADVKRRSTCIETDQVIYFLFKYFYFTYFLKDFRSLKSNGYDIQHNFWQQILKSYLCFISLLLQICSILAYIEFKLKQCFTFLIFNAYTNLYSRRYEKALTKFTSFCICIFITV